MKRLPALPELGRREEPGRQAAGVEEPHERGVAGLRGLVLEDESAHPVPQLQGFAPAGLGVVDSGTRATQVAPRDEPLQRTVEELGGAQRGLRQGLAEGEALPGGRETGEGRVEQRVPGRRGVENDEIEVVVVDAAAKGQLQQKGPRDGRGERLLREAAQAAGVVVQRQEEQRLGEARLVHPTLRACGVPSTRCVSTAMDASRERICRTASMTSVIPDPEGRVLGFAP